MKQSNGFQTFALDDRMCLAKYDPSKACLSVHTCMEVALRKLS